MLDPDRITKMSIGHGIRKTRCCIGRLRAISKPFSLTSENAAARFRTSSNARCGPICLVVCWPAVFCGSSVNRAARIGCCRCLARADPFVPPVAEGAWSTQRRTLFDRVFPRVPVRQWVLSLPFALRYRLAYDSEMVTAVLGVFIRALFGLYRRMARDYGIDQTQCGAVTFVQRFGSAANLHFHVICIDGVYAPGLDGPPEFFALP